MLFRNAIHALLALATTISAHVSHDFYARNLKTVQSIYNLTVFPNNVPIRTNGSAAVPPGLFSANASGRVTPLGNFTGFNDSIEYFFALALIPAPPLYPIFSAADVVSFQSGCAEVASSVVYLRTSVLNASLPNNGQYINSLKQIAFWRFDEQGAVLSYDAVHCPHTGPTGGMKCVDEPYDDAYFGSDERLFGRPEGETFFCLQKGGHGY